MSKQNLETRISRRHFLQVSAFAAATAMLDACAPFPTPTATAPASKPATISADKDAIKRSIISTAEALASQKINLQPGTYYDLVLIVGSTATLTADKIFFATKEAIPILNSTGSVVAVLIPVATALSLSFDAGLVQDFISPQGHIDVYENGIKIGNRDLNSTELAVIRDPFRSIISSMFEVKEENLSSVVDAHGRAIVSLKNNTASGASDFKAPQPTKSPEQDQDKLNPDQKNFDTQVKKEGLADKLKQALWNARLAKDSNKKPTPILPPQTKEIKDPDLSLFKERQITVFIYNPRNSKWNTDGSWRTYPNQLANQSPGFEAGPGSYYSGICFSPKGSNVRIFSLDSYETMMFTGKDVKFFNDLGYQVMGPGGNWLVQSPGAPLGYIEVPSVLSP